VISLCQVGHLATSVWSRHTRSVEARIAMRCWETTGALVSMSVGKLCIVRGDDHGTCAGRIQRAFLQDMTAEPQGHATARWDDTRIFLAAYRHKSLGTAASRLGLDISTVSRRLAVLEAALGTPLFQRTREGLVATAAANRVHAAAEAMEASHRRFTREASEIETRAEGVVRLSVAPGMADSFIAPLVVRLHARHPRIELELDASERVRDLSRREADLAIRSVRPHGADLVTSKLITASWLPVGAPELVRKLERLTSWNDAPWITWDHDFASFPPARWIARHAPRAQIALRTSHMTSQLTAAETGLGLALVPQPYIPTRKLQVAHHGRALAHSVESCPTGSFWIVAPRMLRNVPRVAAVWSFFSEELRTLMRRPIAGK
jgi:DNA-binding transcriptional LysR family regulator